MAWFGRRVRAVLDVHVPVFVDVLGSQVARWLAEDPGEFGSDFSSEPPSGDAVGPVATGRSLRSALGADATVADFLNACTGERSTNRETGRSHDVTWRDRLADGYESSIASQLVEILVADLGRPAPEARGPLTGGREPKSSRATDISPALWSGEDRDRPCGIEIEIVLDIDTFGHPVAILAAMTLSEALARWGDGGGVEPARDGRPM